MSSYWVSEDDKVSVKTLESYLFDASREGVTSHNIRVTHAEGSDIQFTISPDAISPNALGGEPIDYKIDDNQVYPAHEAFSKPDERMIVFARMGDDKSNWHLAKLDTFSAYLNSLAELRKAAEADNTEEIKKLLQAMREYDAEIGADDEEEDEGVVLLEIAMIPLSPELEALPDVEAFAGRRAEPHWIPIRGKAIDIERIPMILHSGPPANEGEWRVSSIETGYTVVSDDDPEVAVESARENVRKLGVKWCQQRIAEICAVMPPKPTASPEIGFFFCANCRLTDEYDVPYKKRDDNCTRCGFCDWIWEPKDA